MESPLVGTLPSGKRFSVDLRLNHPSLLPGVQVYSENILLKTGKKLRPKLCFMMAEAIGVPLEAAAPFARIAELVHAATLAHDDVIDEATERRGKATLNDRLTQSRAVLSGDLLLARAMVELCDLGNPEVLKRMSEVLEDLVTGEWLQLESRGRFDVTMKTLETIAQLKTASMLEWCVQVPFYLAGADHLKLQLARSFGRHLGIAFQCIDDCLDFSKTSGKDFAKDLKEFQLNQVSRLLLDTHPNLIRNFEKLSEEFETLVSAEALAKAISMIRSKAALNAELAQYALVQLKEAQVKQDSFQDLMAMVSELVNREQ